MPTATFQCNTGSRVIVYIRVVMATAAASLGAWQVATELLENPDMGPGYFYRVEASHEPLNNMCRFYRLLPVSVAPLLPCPCQELFEKKIISLE